MQTFQDQPYWTYFFKTNLILNSNVSFTNFPYFLKCEEDDFSKNLINATFKDLHLINLESETLTLEDETLLLELLTHNFTTEGNFS
jgi:hypothetical protein